MSKSWKPFPFEYIRELFSKSILERHAQNEGSTLSFVSNIKANHVPFKGALNCEITIFSCKESMIYYTSRK